MSGEELVVVDVGAAGGLEERWEGYQNRVVAVLFEPSPSRANELRGNPGPFKRTMVIQRALGDRSGSAILYETRHPGCSSLLRPNQAVLSGYSVGSAFRVIGQHTVQITTYAELYDRGEVPRPDALKIDVQGFDYRVLQGFGDLLSTCLGVRIEAHLYPLYEGQHLLGDIVRHLAQYGLVLRKLRPAPRFDGDIVEVDAWFAPDFPRRESTPEHIHWKVKAIEETWAIPPRIKSFV